MAHHDLHGSSGRRAPRPEAIRSLVAILTAQCNLRCSYCYQNAKTSLHMDWNVLHATIDLALSTAGKTIKLAFSGGEPLLKYRLMQRAVRYAREKCPPDRHIKFSLATNGILLTKARIAFLVRHDFSIYLSLDGIAAAQDARSIGSFAILDGLLDHLRKKHPDFFRNNLTIRATVTPRSIRYLGETVDYFLGKGLRHIAISPVLTACPEWRVENVQEIEAQFRRIFKSSLDHLDRTDAVPLLLFRKIRHEPAHFLKRRSMCGVMLGKTPAVDADGQVYGCAVLACSGQRPRSALLRERLDGLRLGDLRERGFRKRFAKFPQAVLQAEIFDHKENKYSSYGRCRDCRYFAACSICPLAIGFDPANTDPHRIPDFACAFFKTQFKYRELFPVQGEWRAARATHADPARLIARFKVLFGFDPTKSDCDRRKSSPC
ncbi:MAG: radical SAM protein [Acidobacteriia bacterium]|nr:radical SAM protein [Terriglobia bacterium]